MLREGFKGALLTYDVISKRIQHDSKQTRQEGKISQPASWHCGNKSYPNIGFLEREETSDSQQKTRISVHIQGSLDQRDSHAKFWIIYLSLTLYLLVDIRFTFLCRPTTSNPAAKGCSQVNLYSSKRICFKLLL